MFLIQILIFIVIIAAICLLAHLVTRKKEKKPKNDFLSNLPVLHYRRAERIEKI